LLIHSGGLSQRTPHLSAFGKVFATLPNGATLLEMKLRCYRNLLTFRSLPSTLPAGVLISASDVLEDVSVYEERSSTSDMILFATESDLEVASNHGVFVMEDGRLKAVLQKPSQEQLKAAGGILPSGNALTDCFFWISWSVCKQLVSVWDTLGPCAVETCCYGDFMRPLGFQPRLDYLSEGDNALSSWRRAFADIFSKISPEIVNLGENAFFHFGTPQELLEHCSGESTFRRKFLKSFSSTIGSGTLLEYCRLKDANIGHRCIVSGCESNQPFLLGDSSLLFTLCISGRRYVTILLRTDDDVKAKKLTLTWMGKETALDGVSLWEAKMFPVESSRERSLHATIGMLNTGVQPSDDRISMAEAVMTSDIQELVAFRCHLRRRHLTLSFRQRRQK
uniref:Fucokinase domain-containing protein n=1 Tax=Heligmosomoides polygyrus TaxID=6339 RepID=A0A183G4H6_HELPZ